MSGRCRPEERARYSGELAEEKEKLAAFDAQLVLCKERIAQLQVRSPIDGLVVTWDLKNHLIRKPVQRGQTLLRVADPAGPWQLELHMPEDRMGYIAAADEKLNQENQAKHEHRGLPVTYILATDPGTQHQGTVSEIARSAEVHGEEGNTVLIKVAIDKKDLPEPASGGDRDRQNLLRSAVDWLRLVPRPDRVRSIAYFVPALKGDRIPMRHDKSFPRGATASLPSSAEKTVGQANPGLRRLAFVVVLGVCVAAGVVRAQDKSAVATIKQCTLTLIEQAEVPAQEAGVLKSVATKEGRQVTNGDLLAQVDDAKTQMELKVAQAKLAAAKEKATDDINIRYSKASADVAKADYAVNAKANEAVPNAVPQEVLREKLMKCVESSLAIEKAKMEMRIAVHEAEVSQAEVDAAEENINRHHIRAPLNGMVVKVYRHAGEWVQPGDPVLHVVRIDHLWVEGFANVDTYHPSALKNRDAEVVVTLAGGRQRTFPGKVIFVDPRVENGGAFLVRVEVQNVEENGSWVLSPGLSAEMHILLK